MNTVNLSYTKFIKQHEIKSSTKENDAIRRASTHKIQEAVAGVTQHTILQKEASTGCLLVCTPTKDRACYLGMCSDQASDLRPIGPWDNIPTNLATPARAVRPTFDKSQIAH